MDKSTMPKQTRYLKYVIPLVVALVVVLFFVFRWSHERKQERDKVEKEAVKRIETLKGELKEPIDVRSADHFVGAETILLKKDQRIIPTTPKALLEDPSIGPKTEIKVLVEEEKTVITTPKELLANRTIRPDTPIRVIKENGQIIVTTPSELMADESITPDTPIKIIEKVEKVITTTPEELQETAPSPETRVLVVMETPGEAITLSQLLPEEEATLVDTFYDHTVTAEDKQGIWGIIQHGLMDQFLSGIPVETGADPKKRSVLTLDIPENADEPLEEGYSSYLGTLLVRKTRESHVYNYSNGRMGRNPDYISPGQEVVISRFSKEELVEIYRHFRHNS